MNLRKFMYGSMGFLSFIGFLGIITNEKSFLLFFAFVIDFDYWFMKSDEMLEEYMSKSAARGFYSGMITTALMTLFSFLVESNTSHNALSTGLSYGWSVAIIMYSLSTAYYGLKEKWGLEND